MTRVSIAWTTAVILTACADTGGDDSTCGNLTGTYALNESFDPADPGNCPPTDPTGTVQVIDHGMTIDLLIAGAQGGCPGTKVGCSVTAACRFSDPQTGATLATVHLEFDFTATGLQGFGTFTQAAGASTSAPLGCMSNYIYAGTKR